MTYPPSGEGMRTSDDTPKVGILKFLVHHCHPHVIYCLRRFRVPFYKFLNSCRTKKEITELLNYAKFKYEQAVHLYAQLETFSNPNSIGLQQRKSQLLGKCTEQRQ